MPATELGV
jgi:hypothetical protein